MQGLVGHTGTYPCVWCYVHKDDVGAHRASVLDKPDFVMPRTKEKQRALAHLFDSPNGGGTCRQKCCNRGWQNLTSMEQWWAGLSAAKRNEFSKEHMGTYFMQECVFPHAQGVVACFLHLHLMVVCLFWRYFVGKYAITQTKADAISAHLEAIGVATKKIKKQFERQIAAADGSAAEKRPARPTFGGDACFAVLDEFDTFLSFTLEARVQRRVQDAVSAYRDLLDTISPAPTGDDDQSDGEEHGEDQATAAPTSQAQKAATRRARVWEEFWSTQAKRNAQAKRVKDAARAFVKKLANSGIPSGALDSVYIHFLTCHIETQVREYGPLWYWSGEGLEHKNYVWKQTGRAMAQRGLAAHQNGGRRQADGTQVRSSNAGREGQTALWVIWGELHGGLAREGRQTHASRHAKPRALL